MLLFISNDTLFTICVCHHDDIEWRRRRGVVKHRDGTDDFSVKVNCTSHGQLEFILIILGAVSRFWQIRCLCACWQVTFALKLSHRSPTSCHSVDLLEKVPSAPFNQGHLGLWTASKSCTTCSMRHTLQSVKNGGVSTWVQCLALTNLNDYIFHRRNAVALYKTTTVLKLCCSVK